MFKIKWNVRTMTRIALLIAAEVVLARVLCYWSPDKSMKICGEFIAAALGAYLYGPIGGMLIAGLGDFIGAAIVNGVDKYNPAINLTAVVVGLILGLLIYKNANPIRGIIAALITQIFFKWILNTYWLSLWFFKDTGYTALLFSRTIQTVILLVVWIPIILAIPKIGKRVKES